MEMNGTDICKGEERELLVIDSVECTVYLQVLVVKKSVILS